MDKNYKDKYASKLDNRMLIEGTNYQFYYKGHPLHYKNPIDGLKVDYFNKTWSVWKAATDKKIVKKIWDNIDMKILNDRTNFKLNSLKALAGK